MYDFFGLDEVVRPYLVELIAASSTTACTAVGSPFKPASTA